MPLLMPRPLLQRGPPKVPRTLTHVYSRVQGLVPSEPYTQSPHHNLRYQSQIQGHTYIRTHIHTVTSSPIHVGTVYASACIQ